MTNELVRSDRDRGFADWGTTVVLRRVNQSFDPETGELTETYDDREVTAVAGEWGQAAVTGSAGHAGKFAQMFLVRSESVESASELRSMRVVHAGQEYRVDDIESWSQAQLILLKCNRV